MYEAIGASRTLRRTSNTNDRQENLSDAVINRWNRWQKVEASRSGESQGDMRERYEDCPLIIISRLTYPASM